MSVGGTSARIAIWVGMKLIHMLYIPLFIIRKFQSQRFCPPIEDELLLQPAKVLVEKIRLGQITSESVVKAYINRIKQVNPVINAVVADRFEEALEDAKAIDKMIATNDLNIEELKTKYPLLGLPVSVKESIAVKGLSHKAGCVTKYKGTPVAEEDAYIVKLVRDAGAIPLVVTNTPELCMNWETVNKATGMTLNPYDTTKTPGGSSGGEASLLASAASVIGLGSDVCGSLRLPAHFCGVWGHKPSPGIVSAKGHYPDCRDEEAWTRFFTLGPMARYAADLRPLLQVIVTPAELHKLRLDGPVDLQKVRFYYIEDMQSIFTRSVNNEITTGMRKVLAHMKESYGCEPQKLEIKDIKYSPDAAFVTLLDFDTVDYICDSKKEYMQEWGRFLTFRSKRMGTTVCYGLANSIVQKLPKQRREKAQEMINNLSQTLQDTLGDNGVFIFPSFPDTAHPHHDIFRRVFDTSYLAIFNALGFPVTNCPLGLGTDGLPMGIQVAAAPNCDRLTLAVAEEIEKAFGGWTPPATK